MIEHPGYGTLTRGKRAHLSSFYLAEGLRGRLGNGVENWIRESEKTSVLGSEWEEKGKSTVGSSVFG